MLAGRERVALREPLEQARLHGRVDAGTGVGHFEQQVQRTRCCIGVGDVGAVHPDGHLAPFGELQRVRHQVHQHLSHSRGVEQHPLGHVGIDVHPEVVALLVGERLVELAHTLEHVEQPNVGGHHRHLTGFDLGEVEHVAHQHQQVVGAPAGHRELAASVVGQRPVGQQRQHADHAVQRRADLVAHRREELVLHPGRAFGGLTGVRRASVSAVTSCAVIV